jgi:hypothetical protein
VIDCIPRFIYSKVEIASSTIPIGGWGAAVDALEAADRTAAVEGGFILRDECISRIIKFDSKQSTVYTHV